MIENDKRITERHTLRNCSMAMQNVQSPAGAVYVVRPVYWKRRFVNVRRARCRALPSGVWRRRPAIIEETCDYDDYSLLRGGATPYDATNGE